MKAIVYGKYGSPDVLELVEIDSKAVRTEHLTIRDLVGMCSPRIVWPRHDVLFDHEPARISELEECFDDAVDLHVTLAQWREGSPSPDCVHGVVIADDLLDDVELRVLQMNVVDVFAPSFDRRKGIAAPHELMSGLEARKRRS